MRFTQNDVAMVSQAMHDQWGWVTVGDALTYFMPRIAVLFTAIEKIKTGLEKPVTLTTDERPALVNLLKDATVKRAPVYIHTNTLPVDVLDLIDRIQKGV